MMKSVLLTTFLFVVLPDFCRAVDGQVCYTSGGVAGIVIATVVVTIVMGGLIAAGVWYLWKQRPALAVDGKKKKPGSTFFTSAMEKNCTNIDPKLPEKVRPPEGGGKEAYAFDNPYFKDDEADGKSKNQDAAEKGEAGFKTDNGNIRNSHENKVSAGQKVKKNRPFSNIQFPNVFHQGFKKPRAMDDTFMPKPLERVEVPLRGHDFTGLGFNICGNMRDGIFVKDVLHRGPASESGKIKAGDRIVGVWVSFGGMVYEDALTILSYASPYDVRLELEKTVDPGKNLALPASSPASKTRLVSSSFRTGQRLFHPLYRSQSFDDLTQIGKDNHLALNNNNAAAMTANPNSCSSCPKRSQSIEGATSPKPRIQQDHVAKQSRKSSTSSCESAKKGSPIIAKAAATVEPVQATNGQSSPTKAPAIENVALQTRSAELQVMTPQANDTIEMKSSDVEAEEPTSQELPKNEVTPDDRPTAPPRKIPSHVKRKAPAPPKCQDPSKTETSAIVHRDAEDDVVDGTEIDVSGAAESDSSEHSSKVEMLEEANDAHSLSGDAPSQAVGDENEPGSSPKRKASSLGDLTKLDSGRQKKSPATATILERAVSLDLQQSLPEGNLVKQKMILKTPTFEHPEDSSEEDLLPNTEEKKSPANLTRWEGNWFKLQEEDKSNAEGQTQGLWPSPVQVDITAGITNGHSDDTDTTEDQGSYFAFESPFGKTTVDEKADIKVTSTPVGKGIESEFFKDNVDLDDIPYLGDLTVNSATDLGDSSTTINSIRPGDIPSTAPPISLSIPVIKPNFAQYEMLPSPGKIPNAQPPTPQGTSYTEEHRQDILGQEIGNIESTYKPVFSNSFRDSMTNSDDAGSTGLSALDIVNGNGLEISSSSNGQYRTALEDSSASETCILESKSTKEAIKQSLPEVTGIKVHGGAAGFAKTLIICTPIEGESISLNADLDTPPPTLEPPH